MRKTQYLEQLAATTSIDDIVVLTDKLNTDATISNAEALELVDPFADRLIEVLL